MAFPCPSTEQHACARCHEQAAAPAGTAATSLEQLATRYSVDTLAQLLETPPSPMPDPELSAKQRKELAVYLLQAH